MTVHNQWNNYGASSSFSTAVRSGFLMISSSVYSEEYPTLLLKPEGLAELCIWLAAGVRLTFWALKP